MLPKRRRLRAAEVRTIIRTGRVRRRVLVSVKYVPTQGPLRTAVVVSKAVAKKAVERNRVRRAVYRALAPLSGQGEAVIFVQKIPDGPLTPAFAAELSALFA